MKKKSGPGYAMKQMRKHVREVASNNSQSIQISELAVLKARLKQAFQDEEFDQDPWNKKVNLALINHMIEDYNSYGYINTEYYCNESISI